MHVSGFNGTTSVFSGTDVLSESGVSTGYQSYNGSFNFSGVLDKIIVEVGDWCAGTWPAPYLPKTPKTGPTKAPEARVDQATRRGSHDLPPRSETAALARRGKFKRARINTRASNERTHARAREAGAPHNPPKVAQNAAPTPKKTMQTLAHDEETKDPPVVVAAAHKSDARQTNERRPGVVELFATTSPSGTTSPTSSPPASAPTTSPPSAPPTSTPAAPGASPSSNGSNKKTRQVV